MAVVIGAVFVTGMLAGVALTGVTQTRAERARQDEISRIQEETLRHMSEARAALVSLEGSDPHAGPQA